MSWSFKVGQRVVCVDEGWHPRAKALIKTPRKGELYTIRTVSPPIGHSKHNLFIRLVEITNDMVTWEGITAEPHFATDHFRPLVQDTQPWLKEVLEKPPVQGTVDA